MLNAPNNAQLYATLAIVSAIYVVALPVMIVRGIAEDFLNEVAHV